MEFHRNVIQYGTRWNRCLVCMQSS